jgi:protein-tyrosine phosphatase
MFFVPEPRSAQNRFTVLLVCTGNICRSALAERLGRAFLDEMRAERAGQIELASAGTRAVVDSAMHPDSALVLGGLGADAGDFRARQLVESMPAQADLVLTMTRPHRRDVLHVAPRALARTYTLREAADLLQRVAPDAPPLNGTDLATRARSLVAEMAALRSQRHSGADDDIRDPIGQPVEVHEEVGMAIAEALLPVLRRFAGLDVPRQVPVGRPSA